MGILQKTTATLLAVLGCISMAASQIQDDLCFGLALSDGKSMGPYQAGVLTGLMKNLPKNHLGYQAVSGVNEGALNAHIMSQFSAGEESSAAEALKDFWTGLSEKLIYKNWGIGLVQGAILKEGIVDGTPMFQNIEDYFLNKTLKRAVNIGITNIMNGTYVSFNEKFNSSDLVNVLKASIATPGVFAPVIAWDSFWFTGSSLMEVDVVAPIRKCKQLGYKDSKIVIDVILNSGRKIQKANVDDYNAFDFLSRTLKIMNYFTAKQSFIRAQRANPKVNFRYVIGPETNPYFKLVPIQYSKKEVETQFTQGEQDAYQAVFGPLKNTLHLD